MMSAEERTRFQILGGLLQPESELEAKQERPQRREQGEKSRAEAIQSLMEYVEEHQGEDLLIMGFTEIKKNPYKRENLNKCAVM